MLWEDLKEHEFDDAIKKSKGVCAIPMGCVEAHGQHMPLGCDVYQAREYTRRAAEKEPVCVFPSMHFGEKSGAGEFKGTIIFPQRLILDILLQSCKEIARNGFKKILLYNGHGGNQDMLSYFSRSVLYEKNDYMVYTYGIGSDFATPKKLLQKNYTYLTKEDKEILKSYNEQKKRYGHACFIETGWVYGVRPETVRLDKINAESGESVHRFDEFSNRKISSPFAWMADYPNSYAGDFHEGMNERIARAMVEFSTDALCEVIKFLKDETISTDYKKEWLEKQQF